MFSEELFSNLPRLHHLNLSSNLLQDFHNETFEKNEELELLDISHNKFVSFNEFTFKGLEVLEVGTNLISNVHLKHRKSFANKVFNASHNEIQLIDNTIFKHFTFLRHLDLSHNQIAFVTDGTFDTMSILVSIKLNNNALKTIGDSVFSGMKLKRLDLSENQLSSDSFLWSNVELEHLNLTYNYYKRLNASLLDNVLTDLWGKLSPSISL